MPAGGGTDDSADGNQETVVLMPGLMDKMKRTSHAAKGNSATKENVPYDTMGNESGEGPADSSTLGPNDSLLGNAAAFLGVSSSADDAGDQKQEPRQRASFASRRSDTVDWKQAKGRVQKKSITRKDFLARNSSDSDEDDPVRKKLSNAGPMTAYATRRSVLAAPPANVDDAVREVSADARVDAESPISGTTHAAEAGQRSITNDVSGESLWDEHVPQGSTFQQPQQMQEGTQVSRPSKLVIEQPQHDNTHGSDTDSSGSDHSQASPSYSVRRSARLTTDALISAQGNEEAVRRAARDASKEWQSEVGSASRTGMTAYRARRSARLSQSVPIIVNQSDDDDLLALDSKWEESATLSSPQVRPSLAPPKAGTVRARHSVKASADAADVGLSAQKGAGASASTPSTNGPSPTRKSIKIHEEPPLSLSDPIIVAEDEAGRSNLEEKAVTKTDRVEIAGLDGILQVPAESPRQKKSYAARRSMKMGQAQRPDASTAITKEVEADKAAVQPIGFNPPTRSASHLHPESPAKSTRKSSYADRRSVAQAAKPSDLADGNESVLSSEKPASPKKSYASRRSARMSEPFLSSSPGSPDSPSATSSAGPRRSYAERRSKVVATMGTKAVSGADGAVMEAPAARRSYAAMRKSKLGSEQAPADVKNAEDVTAGGQSPTRQSYGARRSKVPIDVQAQRIDEEPNMGVMAINGTTSGAVSPSLVPRRSAYAARRSTGAVKAEGARPRKSRPQHEPVEVIEV